MLIQKSESTTVLKAETEILSATAPLTDSLGPVASLLPPGGRGELREDGQLTFCPGA